MNPTVSTSSTARWLGSMTLRIVGSSAAGKDVQHQGRPINDFHFQQPFQVALLGRGELAVENHQVGTMLVDVLLEIFDLAGADEGPGIGFGPLLQNSPSNDRPGSFSKSREFLQV